MRAFIPVVFAVFATLTSSNLFAKEAMSYSKRDSLVTSYAQCLVDENYQNSRSSVLKPVYWERVAEIREELSAPVCVKKIGGFDPVKKFSSELVRYAVARTLVQREFSQNSPFDFSSVPSMKHGTREESDPTEGLKENDYDTKMMTFLWDHAFRTSNSKIGECIVRKDSKNAWMIIVQGQNVEEDRKLLSTISDALSSCIYGKREFAVSQLVGMISVNYYRLAVAKQLQERPDA